MLLDRTKKIHEQITKETWYKGIDYVDEQDRGLSVVDNDVSNVCKACVGGWLIARYYDTNQDYYHTNNCSELNTLAERVSDTINSNDEGSTSPMWAVAHWNDHPDTDYDNVLNILKELDL